MRYLAALLGLFAFIGNSFAQETITTTIMHDGIEREYILYVPANYTGDEAVPLVFNFHGFGSNAMQQMFYGDMRWLAEPNGFIIAHPNGTLFNGQAHWNVGGFTTGSTTNDVGFTGAMIDTISTNYNINTERIYATGMSNGGYMSILLACQMSDRFAAVASVTGSMSPQMYDNCAAERPVPVMLIHGTDDETVPYEGDPNWTYSIPDVVEYWRAYNNCDEVASTMAFPDTDTGDGSTAEHFIYENGDEGATVELIKVDGGGHTWPGSFFDGPGTNQDFRASREVWKFFERFDINGALPVVDDVQTIENQYVSIFPNPATSTIQIALNTTLNTDYQLINAVGEVVLSGVLAANNASITIAHLPEGLYFLEMNKVMYKVLKVGE